MNLNVVTALVLCFAGVLLEALCAGTGVKKYLGELKWPSFSPPLWAWYTIGIVYYAIIFVCAYRVLQHPATTPFRNTALTLVVAVVVLNAVWSILFFRTKNLKATFFFSLVYSPVVIACWYCLIQFDTLAASALGVYALYLVYANVWGYRVLQLNSRTR